MSHLFSILYSTNIVVVPAGNLACIAHCAVVLMLIPIPKVKQTNKHLVQSF